MMTVNVRSDRIPDRNDWGGDVPSQVQLCCNHSPEDEVQPRFFRTSQNARRERRPVPLPARFDRHPSRNPDRDRTHDPGGSVGVLGNEGDRRSCCRIPKKSSGPIGDDSEGSGPEIVLSFEEFWLKEWASAIYDLGLTDDLFGKCTLRQLKALHRRRREQIRIDDERFAQVFHLLINHWRDPAQTPPIEFHDCLIHGNPAKKTVVQKGIEIQPVEEQIAQVRAFTDAFLVMRRTPNHAG